MSKQKQPRRLADAGVGMFGAESSPSRSAPIALVVSERANKWVVLVLSGTATFMTTLDASIVNIGLPSIARVFGVPLSGNRYPNVESDVPVVRRNPEEDPILSGTA